MARMTLLPFLSAALPFAILAAAQIRLPGYDYSIAEANASGVYELPGLLLDSNGLTSFSNNSSQAWRLTQTVTRRPSDLLTLGNSYFTVSSESNSSLQYVACARWFSVPDDVASASQADDGSCSAIVGADCVRDLKDQYLREATALANQEYAANYICGDFFASIGSQQRPASCQNFFESPWLPDPIVLRENCIANASTLQAVSTGPNDTSTRPFLTKMFDTGSYSSLGLADAQAAAPKQASNYTAYDAAVRSITSFIIIRLGNTTATSQNGFADVQMVCARAKEV
ncbi:hypothetical protein H2199_006587 [Coniosporium tulheliwenetii]|uniref:Uncharacterized protein n=1 Tax=Coniosporium tulheliwenetii TaxID=3383036 RepID=A0ACC2YVW7_9PEZI|nr:hypothetical protein H2199_006587 [Cladosporium sp. JES 115]